MARSVRSLITDLNIALRDTAGSQNIWPYTEKYQAVQEAVRKARPHFKLQDVYTSLVIGSGGVYALPNYVENVVRVDVAGVGLANSLNPVWQPVRNYVFHPSSETRTLYIEHPRSTQNARVFYTREIPLLPVETSLAANVDATQGYIPVINTGTEFLRAWAPLMPTYIQLGAEIIRVEVVTATSFTGIIRGALGTSPQANSLATGLGYAWTSNQAISPVLPDPYPEDFVLAQAKRELMLMRLNDVAGDEQRDVATLAAEYGRDAEAIRQRQGVRNVPRVMQQWFPPRR